MRLRGTWLALSTCLTILAHGLSPASAFADIAAPDPIPMRVARADLVFVGEVVGVLDQDIHVLAHPQAKAKTPNRIVMIRVLEGFVGTKKKGQLVKAGYPVPKQAQQGRPVVSSRHGSPLARLKIGQKAVLFLKKHPSGKFAAASGFYAVAPTPQPGGKYYKQQLKAYSKQLAEIRSTANVLANPAKALQSKDPEVRLLAVATYIATYRTYPTTRPVRMEPIDPKTSQLILTALAKADWKKPQVYTTLHPLNLFLRLGISPKDGLVFPPRRTTQQQMREIVQRWLRENATKYRIKRYAGGPKK